MVVLMKEQQLNRSSKSKISKNYNDPNRLFYNFNFLARTTRRIRNNSRGLHYI